MKQTVYIIGPTFGLERVFPKYGYVPYTEDNITSLNGEPDFVCWTGGTDISPRLYGEEPLAVTQRPNLSRDEREVLLWKKYKDARKLGVCRGAQLLNVLNGGKLYQHVNNHSGSNHTIHDYKGRDTVVCSVHHQMMIPPTSGNFQLLSWSSGVSSYRLDGTGKKHEDNVVEPEVLFFPEDKALCFQAHPEFGPDSCTDYFFQLIKEVY